MARSRHLGAPPANPPQSRTDQQTARLTNSQHEYIAVLILALIAAAFAIALLRGGHLSDLANVQFRYFWLLFVPLLIQLVLFTPLSSRLSIDLASVPSIYVLSMLAGAVVAWFNRSLPGFPLLLAGLLSNLLVISLNGGLMPVSPEARIIAGMPPVVGSANNVSVMTTDSVLWILGDTLPVPKLFPLANVYSIGDILIDAGGVLFVFTVLRPGQGAAGQEKPKGPESAVVAPKSNLDL